MSNLTILCVLSPLVCSQKQASQIYLCDQSWRRRNVNTTGLTRRSLSSSATSTTSTGSTGSTATGSTRSPSDRLRPLPLAAAEVDGGPPSHEVPCPPHCLELLPLRLQRDRRRPRRPRLAAGPLPGRLPLDCLRQQVLQPGFGNIWGILFVLSKIPELGDTYFIILRKQKLIFLHWYHHFSVMIFCTHLYGHRCSAAFWFSVMNYAVHAVMYTYYFVRAMGFRLPKPISMSVTTLQISQMFMGNFIVYYVLYQKYVGTPCQSLDLDLYYGTFIYGSYMVLFAIFFFSTPTSGPDRPLRSSRRSRRQSRPTER
ncbi:putative elongation of very long chain fatty acids protein 6-like [Apostichopus japonicus]|uniref:Elongation of very long chain fatty acids protein n=1 Tax=Stichopus japonicus TaxID=307972 RepID=A0A2G8LK44_STIJA|nr:putative elongation of very long chain fatty acids protein 6-like [Apostichopus japonicus]